jgi:hypothetical protein
MTPDTRDPAKPVQPGAPDGEALAEAIAELRRVTPNNNPNYAASDGLKNTILNAVLSGALIPSGSVRPQRAYQVGVAYGRANPVPRPAKPHIRPETLAQIEERICSCGAGHGSGEGHTGWCDFTAYQALPPRPAEPAQAAQVDDHGFFELIVDAMAEADKAMRKFPQPNYVISKVAEEAGEVVKAAIHCAEGRETVQNLRGEMKQCIAMLYRLWVEGDQVHGLPPVTDALIAAAQEGRT